MNASVEDKICLVTGAARGLGEACARRLAAGGARVVLVDVLEPELDAIVDDLRGAGHVASGMTLDLGDDASAPAMVGRAVTLHGRLDVLVQNAAVQVEKPLHETTDEDWTRLQRINLEAPFRGAREALVHMLDRTGGGVIVNIASTLGLRADPKLAAYTVMKHAVVGLTRAIASNPEYARANIRCVSVCPGDVLTDMQRAFWAALPDPDGARELVESQYPNGRIASVEEVAEIIAFLVSDAARLLQGTEIIADNGRFPIYY